MKIYTIANKGFVDHGQSGHKETFRICRGGLWETEAFPLVFRTKTTAQKYLESFEFNSDKQIVELDLVD